MIYFLGLLLAVEVYYWFWWLPRNWRDTREAADFTALRELYGQDGTIAKNIKDGHL